MFENELSTSEDTPESSGQATPEGSTEQPVEGTPQEILDLDSVQKFKFAGKEWTPNDFKGAYMMQADYSRKTQEIAKERKYYENLSYDLEAVQKDPNLIDKFKSIYPKSFHSYLRYVQSAQTPTQGAGQSQAQSPIDPSFKERFEKLESEIHDRKVQAYSDELEAKSKQLSDKYPMADEEAVLARAQALLDRGEKLTDKVWDSLWKTVNDRNLKAAEQHYSKKVKEQKTTNLKAKDVASGGGTPGPAPRQARTIKDATRMLMESENL